MLKSLLKIIRQDPVLDAHLSKFEPGIRPHAEVAVARHVERRLGSRQRREFIKFGAAGVGLSALALTVPFGATAASFWAGLLESALELLRNFLDKALERIRFARQASASQVAVDNAGANQQSVAPMRAANGEVLFYNQNGGSAEQGSFPMNGSRALTFAPNYSGDRKGSIASLHRNGRSASDGRLWALEYREINNLEQAVASPHITPATRWDRVGETPALERRIIDSGRDPAIWKPSAVRRYDRAAPGAPADNFQLVQLENLSTRESTFLV